MIKTNKIIKKYKILNIILFIFFIKFIGCSSIEEVDIWPIVYYEKDKQKKETKLDLFLSLYSYRDNPKETTHAFRPLFVGEFKKEKDNPLRLMFLWPFINLKMKKNDMQIWVLPFYYYRDLKRPELGERDFDWFFLPFLAFGGIDKKEGNYLYMTFWGNMRGLFGYDEIKATPFPFYVKARDGKYITKGYLWPLFRFGDGGGKKFRFYCFLYSYYEKKGKFKRRTYLWPFIHYNEEYLDKKYPVTEFLFFPLFGYSKSKVSLSTTFLWPFFSYAYNTKKNYVEYNIPWPFFKYRTGRIEELRIWPFYWKSKKKIEPQGVEKDLVILWPFFWHSYSDYLTYEKDSYYFLPFFWSHLKKIKPLKKGEKPQIIKRLKIWPLFSYKKSPEGKEYRVLSPLWFEDYIPYGIKKAWLPLFTLFDYTSGKNIKKFSILGPLYQYEREKGKLYHRFLFFSYKKVKNKQKNIRKFSILGGLFYYYWDKGENSIGFFYLPALIKWGTKKKDNK